MIRVAIAERHSGIRSGLRQLLAEAPDLALVAETAYAGELLAPCRAGAWEVVLLNVSPRDQSGHEALRALRRHCPRVGLVALTFALDYTFLHECLSAGAAGLVAAEDVDVAVLPAIRAVAAGDTYWSAGVREALDAGPSTS
jgi:DNA-binding NarL/FixJ family response regulator